MIEGKTGPLAFEKGREGASGGGWWTRVRQGREFLNLNHHPPVASGYGLGLTARD